MQLRIVNFDTVTRNFQPYADGAKKIEEEKKKAIESIEPQRKEMENIIRSHSSGLVINDITQKANLERLKDLQDELMQKDQEFKYKFKQMRDELNTSVYNQLEEIITEWSKNNGIDMVLGKMEVVFVQPEFEITEQIIEVIKQKNLFVEEEQPQSV